MSKFKARKSTKFALVLCCAEYCSASTVLFAKSAVSNLPFPDSKHALETLNPNISGFYVDETKVLLAPNNSDYFIETPIERNTTIKGQNNNKNKTPSKDKPMFGPLVTSKRIKFEKGMGRGWSSFIKTDAGYGLIHGRDVKVKSINSKMKFGISRDMIFDRGVPAADSRGEPSKLEIRQQRSKFLNQFTKASNSRLLSMAKIRSKSKRKKINFLGLMALKSFPLVKISCDHLDQANCKIDRFCNLEGGPKLDHNSISSLTFQQKTKKIFILDSKKREIYLYKYQSCYHSQYERKIVLPKKLKKPTSIFVDQHDMLWVATNFRDDYHNASLYYWEKGQW